MADISKMNLALLAKRVKDLTRWLEKNAPECVIEQRQLDASTPEQVYWHYGYLCAVRDALSLYRKSYSEDTSSRN
jgi:hypothetical protein